jgi:hypothetical protein
VGFHHACINSISVNRPVIRRFVPMEVSAFQWFTHGYNTF